MTKTLDKEQDISLNELSQNVKKVTCLVTSPKDGEKKGEAELDIDLMCFALDLADQTKRDEDFIYFNNEQNANNSIRHLGKSDLKNGQEIAIDLEKVDFETATILFFVTLYDADLRKQTIKDLQSIKLDLYGDQSADALVSISVDSLDTEATVMKLVTLERAGNDWYVKNLSQAQDKNLTEFVKSYGMLVAGT